MLLGFKHRATATLPNWANCLLSHYWIVRVERRNKTKLRSAYRSIEKEKLRLVELGIDVDKVNAVCKYLVSLKQVNADRLKVELDTQAKQLSLNFYNY